MPSVDRGRPDGLGRGLGHLHGADAGEAEGRRLPRLTGSPQCDRAALLDQRRGPTAGRRSAAPAGDLVVDGRDGGVTAPWSGLISSITRQLIPAAKNEIAIGVNTANLNAVAQRMRSVSTAKMRPRAVTSAGTTATQIAVFLTDVSGVSSGKIVVVVEADERVAGAVVEAADRRPDRRVEDPDAEQHGGGRQEAAAAVR